MLTTGGCLGLVYIIKVAVSAVPVTVQVVYVVSPALLSAFT
jgi:hypothetical protein